MPRRLSALLVVLASLVLAAPAAAEIVLAEDWEGRTIRFDVQAPDVDVAWYTELLRNAGHGDEITRVTIRILAFDDLRLVCGLGALGCYSDSGGSPRMIVPAGRSAAVAHTVLHEYAHHFDASHPVPAAREPNGTPGWWQARQIPRLLRERAVAHTYALGWERAIGEIFAEDYVQVHLQSPFRISWLAPPGETVLAALRADLQNAPAEPVPAQQTPVVVVRRATLAAGRTISVPFQLLGPGRRVTFSGRLSVRPAGARARLEIRCLDGFVARRLLVRGASRSLDLRNRGPATCDAVVRNTGRTRATVAATLRLALEGEALRGGGGR